jgi:GrpB-like predicted nucleotidyltransferase (UPF0157 family)
MESAYTEDMVVIVDYDPAWPILFEEERAHIEPAIATFAQSIEHVGSTSVPGLCAKPIVDLMVTVERLNPPSHYTEALAAFGYVLRVDAANTKRHAFGKRDAHGKRPVPGYNLHVVQHEGVEHQRMTAFRDYLRTHADAAGAYGDLKRRLAAEYGANRDGYTAAKSAFVRSIETIALGRPHTQRPDVK